MDFSRYGAPSEQWRTFAENNPSVTRDGYENNHFAQAAELRATQNSVREATAERTMARTGLHNRVQIKTFHVPSRDTHTIPIRRYTPREMPSGNASVLLFFHGGGMLFGSEKTDDVLCLSLIHI